MLRDVLSKFHQSFLEATHDDLRGNAFAHYARNDAAESVRRAIQRPDLKVIVSIGQGNWAEIPWIGMFNPEVTETATNGIYVVYLFNAAMTCESRRQIGPGKRPDNLVVAE